MLLCDALGIREHDVVCFVGAGGKTLASMQIARELAACGRHTLLTTTTRINQPVPGAGEVLVYSQTLTAALEQVHQASRLFSTVLLASDRPREGPVSLAWMGADYPLKFEPYKLTGVPPDWIDPLVKNNGIDVVLIEADGAAHRMLKAPNNHEPVIPACATLVVPMADVEALGKPLSDEIVHRPTLLADLAGLPVGSPISPELIAIALAHPLGGLKSVPAGARVVPLLTTHGRSLVSSGVTNVTRVLLLCPSIDHTVIAYLRATPVVCEAVGR